MEIDEVKVGSSLISGTVDGNIRAMEIRIYNYVTGNLNNEYIQVENGKFKLEVDEIKEEDIILITVNDNGISKFIEVRPSK
ncbi:hypothetical protein [Miniphocaeibacter halophilus]|uniref:Uncharacterized protein n=1 Tax=Miniphocaeibacter halophilus TaxID=2931922 RepID=A0AC61MRU0_9FIRM|nr:hypothetical protein [Miniphocaeibacter halophilus]QQK08211.1 hypothetical protein JFY71_01350 [Miniphocaeibacter halophilus]